MSTSTELPAARPIELPETSAIGMGKTAPVDHVEAERAAQTGTDDVAVEDTAAVTDASVDHTGEDFELDLGSSRAPVLLFSVLAGLAVLLGVYADPLPVQIVTGLIAVGAGALAIRATARRNR